MGISKEKYGMSHCPFLIASLTNKLSSTRVRGPCTKDLRLPILDHLSYQNDKELLLPIIQWEPLAHRFSLLVMVDQILEKPRFLGLPFLQYFFLKLSAHSSPLLFLNLQQSLVVRTRFLCLAALIPNPPS